MKDLFIPPGVTIAARESVDPSARKKIAVLRMTEKGRVQTRLKFARERGRDPPPSVSLAIAIRSEVTAHHPERRPAKIHLLVPRYL